MMKTVSFIILLLLYPVVMSGQSIRVITDSGFDYLPDTLEAAVGDTVRFKAGSSHPTLQVDLETYENSETTALEGGFFFPQGKGDIILEQEDTLYYLCPSHIDQGMRGMILVRTKLPTPIGMTIVGQPWEVNRVDERIFEVNSELAQPYIVSLYDLTGKCVYRVKSTGVHTINGQHLHHGLFILRVQSGDKMMTRRILLNPL